MYWTPPASFGKVVRQPGKAAVAKSMQPVGRFAESPLPRAALGPSYGVMVRSPSEKAALRRHMAGIGTGSWGPLSPDRGSTSRDVVVSKTRALYRSEQVRRSRWPIPEMVAASD
ncbi:hypothetical protein V5799_011899 [Amblyomma americanum]|uniref:Uncharacterized protein n=1 Tax=Amblyomma americanum TaxID=6943 RepID=A0AAQ4EG11_AMBAM